MAETQYNHDDNGQEVTQEDLNLLSEGALQDDRTLAELLRITPYDGATVVKRVIPYRQAGYVLPANNREAIVWPGTGGVAIAPFRAIIGSRTAYASDAKEWWRDIRSAIQTNTSLTLDSDSGGGGRWDLIYAAVTVDDNTATQSRKVKNPSTLVVSTQNVNARITTSVQVLALKGTEGPGAKPTLPSDAGNVYYFGLAYVKVPAGFVSGATALTADRIWEWVTCSVLSTASGACVARPADQNSDPSGTVETRSPWNLLSNRSPAHLPSTMVGKEDLLIALDLTTGNESHNNGDVVDSSRDWSKRLFKWRAFAISGGSTPYFPWEVSASTPYVPSESGVDGTSMAGGFGQSMVGTKVACYISASMVSELGATSAITLSVDANGQLVVSIGNIPNAKIFIWLEASAQYANAS